jgi:hypothetical protein
MPQTCFVLSPMTAVRHADILLSVHAQGHVTDLAGPLGSLETEKKFHYMASVSYQNKTTNVSDVMFSQKYVLRLHISSTRQHILW